MDFELISCILVCMVWRSCLSTTGFLEFLQLPLDIGDLAMEQSHVFRRRGTGGERQDRNREKSYETNTHKASSNIIDR